MIIGTFKQTGTGRQSPRQMLILICWYVAVILVKDASDVNKTHTVDDSQAQKQKVLAPTAR